MPIEIANLSYVPTLSVRVNEMIGLEKLPSLSKDRLQPLFLLAPWPNAGQLSSAVDRIEIAFPDRPYFMDLDRDYVKTNEEAPAQIEWSNLFSSTGAYENWQQFVSGHEYINPCIQHLGLTSEEIVAQVNAFQELDRTYALRLELSRLPKNLPQIIEALNSIGTADFVVIVDAGWQQDTVQLRLQFSQLINTELATLGANVPIVVSYTTIPKEYTDIEGVAMVAFDNRALIADVQAATNRATLIYGDWGSTRPRENKRGGVGPPRIDYPVKGAWMIARNPGDWGYSEAATALMKEDDWQDDLGIWGEALIKQTPTSTSAGIGHPGKNIASRVNIHLHVQAFYDEVDIGGLNLDEEWQD